MRRPPQRKRTHRRSLLDVDPRSTFHAATVAVYSGSPEHKLPHARSDATLCPPELEREQDKLTAWLRKAILAGHVGGYMEGAFPRYVWYRDADSFFEGRLTNYVLGEYHGYPVGQDEFPAALLKNEPSGG